jgi:NNP family nitrate/nitrite transporter-like MFS transporter
MEHSSRAAGAFAEACRDRRVWALALLYAASFGIELTIDNIAALYFTDYFHLTLTTAGVVAGSFGTMNLFARALGGIVSTGAIAAGDCAGACGCWAAQSAPRGWR